MRRDSQTAVSEATCHEEYVPFEFPNLIGSQQYAKWIFGKSTTENVVKFVTVMRGKINSQLKTWRTNTASNIRGIKRTGYVLQM